MTSEAVRVRNVARTDFDQWLPLWESYNAFYERVGPKAVPMEVTRTTWSRFFDHSGALSGRRGCRPDCRNCPFHLPPQYNNDRSDLLSAGPVHQTGRERQGSWPGAHRGRLRTGANGGGDARVLANARDKRHGPTPLRQRRSPLRLHCLSERFVNFTQARTQGLSAAERTLAFTRSVLGWWRRRREDCVARPPALARARDTGGPQDLRTARSMFRA